MFDILSRHPRATRHATSRYRTAAVACALVAAMAGSAAAEVSDCRVFLLREVEGELTIDTIELKSSPKTTRTFHADADSGIIDMIFPVGPGGSGSMVSHSDKRTLTATCDSGTLTVEDRSSDGKGYTRPARDLADLARYDIRVSVSAGDGRFANFLIRQNETVGPDPVGPVLDMFAGRIPVQPGDFVLFTDTYRTLLPDVLTGDATLELDRWPIATVQSPGNEAGAFIVDTGAGTTIVDRAFLPKNTKIKKSGMIQYSTAGRQTLKYAPGGATGQVQTVLGRAVLPELRIGTVQVGDLSVDVLSQMPNIFPRPLAGIIGLDFLRQTGTLSFHFHDEPKVTMTMQRHDKTKSATRQTVEIPFTFVNSHLVVSGRIQGHPVHFIVDTGAPDSILDAAAARRIGLQFETGATTDGRGLDGGSVAIHDGASADITFENRTFPQTALHVSALPVFQRMAVHEQNVGLLGTAFFARAGHVEFDFSKRVMRLGEP